MSRTTQLEVIGEKVPEFFSNRYKLIEKIGKGGSGDVYKAVDNKLNRTIAIKFITSIDNPARFEQEAKIMSGLLHPHLLQIYDFNLTSRILVMEFADGGSLENRIGRLSNDESLQIAAELIEGTAYLHGQNIVHRDLKPANVLLTSGSGVKIADYGLAIKSDERNRLTEAGKVIGTQQYMSPQRKRGGIGDKTDDIWSIGVMLGEMLIGKAATNIAEVLPRLQEFGFQGEVLRIIRRCLYENPSDRYPNAGLLLKEFLEMKAVFSDSTPLVAIKSDSETAVRYTVDYDWVFVIFLFVAVFVFSIFTIILFLR